MRRILTALFGTEGDASALAAALRVAESTGGNVAALHVTADPYDNIPLIGDAMTPQLLEASIESARQMGEERKAAARSAFDKATAGKQADWLEKTGSAQGIFASEARLSDICVIGGMNPHSEPTHHLVFESLLFGSGRPILLVPQGHDGPVGTRAAIAWNDTAEASRAVAGALPMLEKATSVEVLTVLSDGAQAEHAEGLCGYLKAHGIEATPTSMKADERPTAAALLERSKALGSDLLVLGGYGHSRIGEIVFGGVTREIVSHYELPVLIAH